ncbi:hypothetical protein [Priestia koreensis]|uniref:hypothetical protein n=1 Tax=Priestia koreensis TaxID=284581 RepID=UPI001F5AF703|nr:hypothetical protein [Priestia koreensis]UNL85274.1 hypothetical protein IE339_01660 [Priestia koreensis]
MPMQTKLVSCGSTVFVYDYHGIRSLKELGFEQDLNGSLLNLKRLLLTNFVDNRILISFRLRVTLTEPEGIQSRLNSFIYHVKRLSRHSTIKYLGVLELPSKASENFAYINLVTNVESHELINELDEKQLEKYFKEKWGDNVVIYDYSPDRLLEDLFLCYSVSITRNNFIKYPKLLFEYRLEHPLILWNEEANTFIKDHKLLDYPKHRSDEIFDRLAGFVISNEYSF